MGLLRGLQLNDEQKKAVEERYGRVDLVGTHEAYNMAYPQQWARSDPDNEGRMIFHTEFGHYDEVQRDGMGNARMRCGQPVTERVPYTRVNWGGTDDMVPDERYQNQTIENLV